MVEFVKGLSPGHALDDVDGCVDASCILDCATSNGLELVIDLQNSSNQSCGFRSDSYYGH